MARSVKKKRLCPECGEELSMCNDAYVYLCNTSGCPASGYGYKGKDEVSAWEGFLRARDDSIERAVRHEEAERKWSEQAEEFARIVCENECVREAVDLLDDIIKKKDAEIAELRKSKRELDAIKNEKMEQERDSGLAMSQVELFDRSTIEALIARGREVDRCEQSLGEQGRANERRRDDYSNGRKFVYHQTAANSGREHGVY